jgi:hypothetical protein
MMHLKLPEKQYEAKLRITRAEINGMETKKINTKNQCAGPPWLMPVILATQEAEIRGSLFEASLGKKFMRPYLKKPFA